MKKPWKITVSWALAIVMLGLTISPALADDYVIGDGDVLEVSVWGVPELSGPATVRPDGKITLPAVGDVTATGLTPTKLSQVLNQALANFIKQPTVTVRVAQVTNNRIYVAGDGIPSQVYHLASRMTLFNFLCSLPGLENGDLRRAYLIRDRKRLKVDFHALLIGGDFSQDLPLAPDDTLFIPSREQSKVYVLGAVTEPRFLYFRDGLKVLDAILEAGGFNEFAKVDSVMIHRRSGEKIRVQGRELLRGKDLGQNIFLEPGDYITVEESFF